MKKAQKEKIISVCEKLELSAFWPDLLQEIYDRQMSGKKCIIASVKSVSSSGMSRKLKFAVIRKDGSFQNVTALFCKIYGVKMTKDFCLMVNGCGMDMIFEVLNVVFYKITLREDFANYDKFCRYELF